MPRALSKGPASTKGPTPTALDGRSESYKGPSEPRPPWHARPLALAALVFFASCAVYINSLGGQFVFDDTSIIQGNPQIRSISWDSLGHIFGSHYWQGAETHGGLYRPVVMLSYAINYAWGELDPWGYHLINVLVHGLNSALVLLVILELFRDRAFAMWSGLLFALHPIHTEGVAYVVGRAESL